MSQKPDILTRELWPTPQPLNQHLFPGFLFAVQAKGFGTVKCCNLAPISGFGLGGRLTSVSLKHIFSQRRKSSKRNANANAPTKKP